MIKKRNIFVLAALFAAAACQEQQTIIRCCQIFDETNTRCLSCPHGAIPFGNDCVLYLDRCEKYQGCYSCSQCYGDYELVDTEFNGRPTKKCEPSMKHSPSASVTINLQKSEQTEVKTEKDTANVKEEVQKQVSETKQQKKGESSNSNETKQQKVKDKEQEIASLLRVQSQQQNIRKQAEKNGSGEVAKEEERANDASPQKQIKVVEQPKQGMNLKVEKATDDVKP